VRSQEKMVGFGHGSVTPRRGKFRQNLKLKMSYDPRALARRCGASLRLNVNDLI